MASPSGSFSFGIAASSLAQSVKDSDATAEVKRDEDGIRQTQRQAPSPLLSPPFPRPLRKTQRQAPAVRDYLAVRK